MASELRVYSFVGEGRALGARIVIIAKEARQARRLAKEWAEEAGVDYDTFELDSSEKLIDAPAVVYAWNGDY